MSEIEFTFVICPKCKCHVDIPEDIIEVEGIGICRFCRTQLYYTKEKVVFT